MSFSCGCGLSPSLPGSSLPPAYKALDGMAVSSFTANGVMVVDDNWSPRVLTNDGVTVTRNGVTRNTDGSIGKGVVDLNPELVSAVDSFIGLLGTRMVRIGAHPQDDSPIPDGSTFMMQGGQWQTVSISQLSRTFDPSTLRTGGKQLLSLACSTGGTVELGLFTQTPGTVIYVGEDGGAVSTPIGDIATDLVTPLCEAIPALDIEEDGEFTSVIGCTVNGLRKSPSAAATNAYYLNPIQQVYFQGKTEGLPFELDLNAGDVEYFPPLSPVSAGTFSSNWVDVDLTEIPGYSERATAVIISAKGILVVSPTVGVEQWHLVMVVGGEERIRLVAGPYVGSWNNVSTQFIVPIPTNKILRIDCQRQVALAGTKQEAGVAVAYVAGFRFD